MIQQGSDHATTVKPRTSTEDNGEMEVITRTTPSSRDSSSASSMEGHASDAYAILLLHQREEQQRVTTTSIQSITDTPTRGRSQSDSATLSPSWTNLTPTSSSSTSQLPPPPKSFSSSCSRRSAPAIPALILPKTPPTSDSTYTVSTTLLPPYHHPSTPLTALSVGDASPGILTPGLIQLRRSFPLPPSTHSHRPNEVVGEDIKTPTLLSSNMAIEEPLYFTSYKLPGAFTSLDSLETVVPRSEDGEQQEQQLSLRLEDTPSTPTHSTHDMQGTPSCSGVSDAFSPRGGCSSSFSSPSPQCKQGSSSCQETMDTDTSTTKNRSKRLRSKKSKASIRSDCSRDQQDVYMNDWISLEFSETTTPTHHSRQKTIYSTPSQSSLKQRQRDIEDKVKSGEAAAGATTTRSISRSSWRSRYSSPSTRSNSKFVHQSLEEEERTRPETAMSTFTTLTYHTISGETVYEDARDYQSGEEADLEDDDYIDLPVSREFLRSTGSCLKVSHT